MRLFISINVPEELHNYCKELQSQFNGIKNTNEFHITIQFLGNDTENPDKLIKTLKQIKFNPFEIEMSNAVPFGYPQSPKGIWIECKATPKLEKLSNEIREKTSKLGYTADRPLKAHITLGKYKESPKEIINKVKGKVYKFTVNKFHLVKSELTESGAIHKILESFPIQ